MRPEYVEPDLSKQKNRILDYLKRSGGHVEMMKLQKKLLSPDIPEKEQELLQMALNQLQVHNRIVWKEVEGVWCYWLVVRKKRDHFSPGNTSL